ncbi:glutamine and serine-rich protein 1 isoform X3 [Microcaecilia unicolor]|uniref:Glutamine and serine-rich protein 1-like isoform X3 n=1 Tax=Microcaecilia unicolor TaxID=1415580 RepID=A0A6P7XMC7_9AMPH|nr:glutamine and serine-rich protein 1-like isoform X3 [Microcaecilia unicolor]
MDRNYPTSSFSEQLPPAGQTSAASWAFERGASTVKASLNYGAETDLFHRQAYTVSQLPGYATTHHPTGLSGIFDTSIHDAVNNTTETSVMNFLTAIESRTAQAAASGTSLLPQFRAASWQTGMHSSTELFVTGTLPTSGTFPPTSALSAYQHPNTFTSRNFVTTPSLTLQDATFSATTNGLLAHDSILQIKASPGTVPTALAFDRLGSTVLSASIPPQSSTYRSAQESAPHLLQPQFSLLPSALGGVQQASAPFNTSVFTGSTASLERALQRECSVIKHHQRPSSTQSVQSQLTVPQHSLPTFLSSGISFQETSRQSILTCSPLGDVTQMSNGGPYQKTSQVSVELTQSYPSVIPSPGYPLSSTKAKNCTIKQPPRSSKNPKPQSIASPIQTPTYTKSALNQSSVIASQAQTHEVAQLPSLLSVSQSPNIPSVSHTQVFTSSKSDTLPSLYKTLTSFSVQSQAITSDSSTLSYSTDQQHVPPSVTDENYSEQTRDMSSANQSQSYPSSLSQGLSPVSQSQVSYSSHSQVLSAVSPSESYTSGPSPSLPFSSQVQNLSTSSSTQNYISVCTSQSTSTQKSPSPQSQKFLSPAQLNFTSPGHSQTSLENRSSSNTESYAKRKPDSNLFSSSKHDNEFPVQEFHTLQQASLDPATQTLIESEIVDHEATYSVSKADDRFSQSVIRSNSRLEDQAVGLTLQACKKDERMPSSVTHLTQQIDHINVHSHDIKKAANPVETSQGNVAAKELSQEQPLVHKIHENKIPEQQGQVIQDHASRHAQQLQLPCDLHVLQQSMLQASLVQTKTSTQTHQIQSPQHTLFLQPQQLHPQTSDVMKNGATDPSKHLQQQLTTKSNFSQANHDSKNQFVSLGSVCFPESMLTDERNILSNVDDILAATAAACGVPQQEFVKSTSNEENTSLENAEGSKSHFQPIGVRHMTPNFSSSPAVAAKLQNIHNLSLNGSQISANLSSVSPLQSKTISLDQTNIETSAQIIPSEIGSSSSRLMHKEQEQISSMVKNQSSTSQESEEDNIPGNGRVSDMKDPDFVSGGKSLAEESATFDNDFNLGIDGKQTKNLLQPKAELQLSLCSSVKGYEENQDVMPGSLHKKREKGKLQKSSAEDENGNQRLIKQAYQSKRPNSKGTDTGLPFSAHESYDGYQHEERIRQKIKEVEEKQPEVKMGFIGSFIDFIKSGPKQQFSAPAVRMTNRSKRQFPLTFRASYSHPPSKPQPMPAASVESSGTSPPKQAEDEVKKELEPLPSFSSDDDDSVGGSNDLQKSICTALSALDETADKKNRSEAEKLVAVVKQEPLLPASPVMNVQEKPKPAEPLPAETDNSADELAKSQLSIAIEGCTDEGSSESGGEGMYKERDEFVVKIEDISSLKVALSTGREPPAIWKVQKALLQKFVPELRNGKREFAATNSYLGYFGDAKTKYKRVYVKFIENSNKKEYVRVCSKKPKIRPAQTVRPVHVKLGTENAFDPPVLKSPAAKGAAAKASAAKGAAAKASAAKGPAAKASAAKGPAAKASTAKGPAAKASAAKGPAAKASAAKGPAVKASAAKASAAKGPAAKASAAKGPAAKASAVKDPAAKASAVKDPAVKDPGAKDPAVNDPAVKDPAVKGPAAKEPTAKVSSVKSKLKQPKLKAEPPPKKRKKWKEEYSCCNSDSSPEAQTDDDELEPPAPFVTRFLNTRAMKESFKSYMELLINIALDSDTVQALEKDNDMPLLPCMKRIDGMLTENRKRLLSKLHLDKSFKRALESFPELKVITREVKTKSGGRSVSKIKMTGKTYNKQTLKMSKTNPKMSQEFAVEPEKIHLCSLYHSLQHHKYHVYLKCKEEVLSLRKRNKDLRPEEILQLCMKNRKWVEELFEKFGELLNHVQQKCL